ncbi:MAG: RadC family protein [Arenicellales bacterium WSBS_2016_MAG_OTU3]
MIIKEWPEEERPREKLISRGATSLSDAELLAIFIRTGVKGRTAVDISRALINEFGGLRNLLNAEEKELVKTSGIGVAKFAQLQAVLEIGKRYLGETIEKDGPLTSANSAKEYLIAKLRDRSREIFCCLFLDTRHQVLAYKELFKGTIDGASVYPRIVVQRALEKNAAAVIIAHNHPSGVAEPSRADESLTRRLQSALELVDIRLLDHFVIGDGQCISLAERGII